MQVDLEDMIREQDSQRLEKAYQDYLKNGRMVSIGEYYFKLLKDSGKIKQKNPHLLQQARDMVQKELDANPSKVKMTLKPTEELMKPLLDKQDATPSKSLSHIFSYVKRLAVEELFIRSKKQKLKTIL